MTNLLLTLALLLPVCSFANTELAKINGTTITLEDFNKKFQDNLKYFPQNPPSKRDVLDDIVRRELAIQEAVKLGLDKDPEVRDRMNSVLFQALLEKKLGSAIEKINISDEEAKSEYKKNPELRTSHIFLAVPSSATKDETNKIKAKMEEIQKELKSSKKTFAEIAQTHSQDPSRPLGGDIDFQNRSRLDPAYYEAALKLKKSGDVSGIVQSSSGFHIIKLTGIHTWDEADKAQVKRNLFEKQRQKLFESFVSDLRKKANVKIEASLLK